MAQKLSLLLFLLFGAILPAKAQQSIADSSIQMGLLEVCFRGGIPTGDWGDRYEFATLMGMQGGVKFRSNWYLTGGVQVLFGDAVNETDVLRHILDTGGLLIGNEGLLTDYRINATGWLVPVSIGKIIPVYPKHNRNSGIFIEVGAQYLSHRLAFQSYDDDVAQITGDYRKGYDRLTAGFGLRQAIGYTYFDNKGYLNLSIGLDFSQSFTFGQRSIQFDTGRPFDQGFIDLLTGLRISWVFPLYGRAPGTYYY